MRPELLPLDLHYKAYGVEDVKLLMRDYSKEGFIEINEGDPRAASGAVEYLVSDNKKFLIDNTAPYFHLLLMGLYPLLQELEESSDAVVVVFRHKSSSQQIIDNNMGSITEYLAKRIVSMGHEVKFLNSDTKSFYINNFNLYDHPVDSNLTSAGVIAKFLSKELDYSKTPFEKVYLSRAKTINRSDSTGLFNVKYNSRVDDPDLLEDYFKSLGFKVLFPEDFSSFDEQLELLASTKILMSMTSASLATSIVMPPGGFIVEISHPVGAKVGSDGTVLHGVTFHDHYKNIATISKSTYVAIPPRESALDLINFIESNALLKSVLSS